LGQAGCKVSVLAGPSDQPNIPQTNVTLYRLTAHYEPPLRWASLRFLYWNIISRFMDRAHPLVWHWLRWDLGSKSALRDIDAVGALDVIEAPEHAANGLSAALARRWPLVVRTHGPWDLFFNINRTRGAAMNRILANLERQSAYLAHLVTAPSHSMAALMEQRWRMPQRPDVVANFMDVPPEPAPLPAADAPQRIVCANRIERFKGQDTLVQAFVRIARRHPQVQLVLLGPDQWSPNFSFEKIVDALAPDPQIRRRIVLSGRVPLQQVQWELRNASLAVICSMGFESFSYSTLEAMAAARPIVGARAGAVPELLDFGHCGLITAPGHIQQMADAMDLLLSDRSLALRLGLAAHARARHFYDTQSVLPHFLAAYDKARKRFRRSQTRM
jgi:glycosyltransferase involved in cell wall biosynthesis